MTDQQDLRARLPELPEPAHHYNRPHPNGILVNDSVPMFTADQMRAYALEAAAQLGRVGDVDYAPGALDSSAPPRVWLQIDTDGDNDNRDELWPGRDVVTWLDEPIGGLEIQYIRADLAIHRAIAADDETIKSAYEKWCLPRMSNIEPDHPGDAFRAGYLAAAPQPANEESR